MTSLTGTMVAVANQAALSANGTVWAWGDNTDDRLGAGASGNYSTMPLIVNLSSGTAPVLTITSGSSQAIPNGNFTTPLTITATINGNPVANALVDFVVINGSGPIVSSTSAPVNSGILQVQTNAAGQASVYYQEPVNGLGTGNIIATRGNQQSSLFTIISNGTGVPAMSAWMLVLLTLLLFWVSVRPLAKRRTPASL
jgi:hypothetical protein